MMYWIEQLHVIAGHEAISRYFRTYCEIATQERHCEFSGIFAETPWQSHRNVTQGDCFVAVWFIMVKIYPAPRNDERLV